MKTEKDEYGRQILMSTEELGENDFLEIHSFLLKKNFGDKNFKEAQKFPKNKTPEFFTRCIMHAIGKILQPYANIEDDLKQQIFAITDLQVKLEAFSKLKKQKAKEEKMLS